MRNFYNQSKRNMSDKIFHNAVYIFNAIVIAGCIFTFIYIVDRAIDRGVPEPTISAWHSSYCLKTVIPADGGVITETAAGNYSYTLLARSDGAIEVWEDRPCASVGTQ